jgi:uncharacterized membrane-anchored protein YjiN (DUF445 family)
VRDQTRRVEPDIRTPEQKRADLRRMRTIALLLLVLMAVIYIATSMALSTWPWLGYPRAFAEAGMVGACADWFAVVALFRYPFGLPIPHTGIVPNNQERIGYALGRFVTNNFLNPKVAHAQLARVDVVGWLTRWINDPDNARQLVQSVEAVLPRVLRSVSEPEIGAFVGRFARRGLEAVPVAPLASRLLAVLWAGGAAQTVLDRTLDLAESALARHKPAVQRIVSEQSSRWIPKWIDNMIAERVMAGLLTTVRELRDPEHPWRIELQQAVERLVAELANDPDMYARGEALKAQVLDSPLFAEQARTLWSEIEHALTSDLHARSATVVRACEAGLEGFGRWLEEKEDRRKRLDRFIRLMALRIILPRRREIGTYVTQVVQHWDTATLVNRIELQVGKDLQYIRINGTLVGGLVGLLIFTVSHWLGSP